MMERKLHKWFAFQDSAQKNMLLPFPPPNVPSSANLTPNPNSLSHKPHLNSTINLHAS